MYAIYNSFENIELTKVYGISMIRDSWISVIIYKFISKVNKLRILLSHEYILSIR